MKLESVGLAYGKLIFTGEHSVVYSKPAIALPFRGASAITHIRKSLSNKSMIHTSLYSGELDKIPDILKGISLLIDDVLNDFGEITTPLNIEIDSTIPLSRGLGSSAAVSISVVRALYSFFDKAIDDSKIRYHVEKAEKVHHSNPSGLDMETILSNRPIRFIRGVGKEVLNLNLKGYIVVGDTGTLGNTSEAVSYFKERIRNNQKNVLQRFETIYHKIIESSNLNDMKNLGVALLENHFLLKENGVSSEHLDKLVACAMDHGALGAKLTGGGMGGCMFAFCDTFENAKIVESALLHEGAIKTYVFNVEDTNE